MWPHSQRSRKICTGVMKPKRFPSAHRRVPMKNSVSGMTNAEDEAIRPKVTMPLLKAWPEDAEDRERRHVGAEQRQQEHERAQRPAGEEVLLAARRASRVRNAKMPM